MNEEKDEPASPEQLRDSAWNLLRRSAELRKQAEALAQRASELFKQAEVGSTQTKPETKAD